MHQLPTVLVVEDEQAIADLICIHLRHNGFAPLIAADAESAIKSVNHSVPDVILLDWMLPGKSGVDLAKLWRSHPRSKSVPILMITAKSEERDKVLGLDTGVDDFITKPFSMQELMARIRAVLRRRAPEQSGERVQHGKLWVDSGAHTVSFNDQPIKLGPTEFKLLNYMMHHPDRVHSRSHLLDRIWGDHVFIEERTVDVHIKRLREQLGEAGEMITTVRGAGYKFNSNA